MKPEHIEDVLVYLHSGQWFGWSDSKNKVYANLVIHGDQEKPTEEWLEAELKRQQAAYDNDYARKRLEEYPSTNELVVALWEGVVEERMQAVTQVEIKRQAVKAKYPK
jgi:hypothetical protein|tara:strand:+ start:738 stop:1061 length:324 start_codon:yes stop_codon:yes gene_type:complete